MSKTKTKTIVQDYATVGQSVFVRVIVTNISGGDVWASTHLGISYDTELINLYSEFAYLLPPGDSQEFTFSFIMPDVTPTTEQPNRFVQVAEYTWLWTATKEYYGEGEEDWQWVLSDGILDSMAIGRQVRIKPPSPQFTLNIEKAPAGAFCWLFQFRSGYAWAQSGTLDINSTWYSPFLAPDKGTSYDIYVWDDEGNRLHYVIGKNAVIYTGKSYIYNCETKTIREEVIELEQTVELVPGESKLISFEAIPHTAKTYQVSVDGLTGSFIAI